MLASVPVGHILAMASCLESADSLVGHVAVEVLHVLASDALVVSFDLFAFFLVV